MGRRRVLYYVQSFGNVPFIQSQIEDISDHFDVHLVCNHFISNARSECLKVKGMITVIPFGEPSWLFRFRKQLEMSDLALNYYNPIYSKKLSQFIDDYDPHIIHCQFGYDALLLYDNFFSRSRAVVVTFRGYDASLMLILRSYVMKLSRFLANANVYPLFVSESLRSNLVQAGIKFNSLNRILYSNIDTSFYKRKSYTHTRDILIFTQVSNFREKKGHLYTLTAFERISEEVPDLDFKIVLIGAIDSHATELMKRFSDSPIYNRIVFTGLLNAESVLEKLEESHFFVHNSVTSKFGDQEGIPNSIMEAMSMELPILTTTHSGIPELDDGNTDIFSCEEKDIDGYCRNIKRVVSIAGYSQRNRERIIRYFGRERFIKELTGFYNMIAP